MTELDQTTEDVSSPLVSPGTLLLQARERAGISQEEVARELHITVTRVKYIESDNYERLITDTFIRGYLRAYAGFLKIDSAPIIAAYLKHAAAQGMITEPQYPTSKEAPTRKLWGFVGLLVLLLAGLWLISVWFFDNQVERPVVVPPAIVPAVPSSSIQPAVTPADSGTEVIPEDPAAATETEAAVESVDEVLPQAQTSTQVSTEPRLDRLELTFADECWLEVSDAQGDVLATELQRPGSSVSLLGVAPFSVKLGNAPAARIKLNGDDVTINAATGTKVMTINVGE